MENKERMVVKDMKILNEESVLFPERTTSISAEQLAVILRELESNDKIWLDCAKEFLSKYNVTPL